MTQGQHYAPSNYTEKRKGKSRKRGLIIGLIVVIVLAIIAGFFAYQNFFGDKTGEVKQGGMEITVVIPAAPRPIRSPRYSSMMASSAPRTPSRIASSSSTRLRVCNRVPT